MAILGNIVLSLLLLLVGAVFIYANAYAFAVPTALREGLMYLQTALTLAAVACLWLGRPQWTVGAFVLVLLISAGILLVNASARPPPPQ